MDMDDAYISYRYVQNLAQGTGLVFNPGEYVEGYTNFLWVLLLAGLHLLTTIEIPLLGRILSSIASFGVILLSYRVASILTPNKSTPIFVFLCLSGSGCLAAYGLSGMETTLFTLLVLGTFCSLLIKRYWLSGFLLAFSILTRWDGILLIPLLGWYITFCNGWSRHTFHRFILPVTFPLIAILGVWNGWRVWYYEALIPNAILAKTGLGISKQFYYGSQYLYGFLTVHLPYLVPIFLVFILLRLHIWLVSKKARLSCHSMKLEPSDYIPPPIWGFLLLLCGGYFLYNLIIGGDWMPGFRYLIPILPFFVLLVGITYQHILATVSYKNSRSVHRFQAILLFFILFGSFHTSLYHPQLLFTTSLINQSVYGLAHIGKWFNRVFPKELQVAAISNGAFSYYSELSIIDVFGLTDPAIAHSERTFKDAIPGAVSFDWQSISQRKPAIICYRASGFDNRPFNYIQNGMYVQLSFQCPSCSNPLGTYMNIRVRHDLKHYVKQQLLSIPDLIYISPFSHPYILDTYGFYTNSPRILFNAQQTTTGYLVHSNQHLRIQLNPTIDPPIQTIRIRYTDLSTSPPSLRFILSDNYTPQQEGCIANPIRSHPINVNKVAVPYQGESYIHILSPSTCHRSIRKLALPCAIIHDLVFLP
jgi:arabinofuranosyltransferase